MFKYYYLLTYNMLQLYLTFLNKTIDIFNLKLYNINNEPSH
jgi:hypothetical protein